MFLYLHGFASSPRSSKAVAFARHFAARGVSLGLPALDEGDFEHLTLSRQLKLIERTLAPAPQPHVLIGSSMGGYLAALHASKHPVAALVLMAPAVDFAARWRAGTSVADREAWERTGVAMVDHHATGRQAPLRFDLARDAEVHAPWPKVDVPTLVFQGTQDTVVPLTAVRHWVDQTPSATLVTLPTDHAMAEVTDRMAEEALRFLATVPAVAPLLR